MNSRKDRGAAAVEFALVAMMLIGLVFGAAEFGRMWWLQSTLAAAARDGAREMAVQNDSSMAESAALSIFPGATVDITPNTGDCDSGGQARAIVTYDAPWLTGLFGSGSITLRGEGVMRCGG